MWDGQDFNKALETPGEREYIEQLPLGEAFYPLDSLYSPVLLRACPQEVHASTKTS